MRPPAAAHPCRTASTDSIYGLDGAPTSRLSRLDNERQAREAAYFETLRGEVNKSTRRSRWSESAREGMASPMRSAEPAAPQAARAPCPPCHWGLMVLSLMMTLLSVPIVYSASIPIALNNHNGANTFLIKQLEFAAIGVAIMIGASRVSAPRLRTLVWVLFAVTVLGLIATDFTPLGLVMGGVRRWMKIGPLQLQFSELAKIALIGVMADFWSGAAKRSQRSMLPWLWSMALTLPVAAMVFIQPHLSAALLLFLLPFAIAFFAGAPLPQFGRIAVPIVCLLIAGAALCKTGKVPGIKEYQLKRIEAHFGSHGADARGANYQKLQGMRALIHGGIFGTGPGNSLFKEGHLPAPHTDFILAVTGEEWGLVGVLGLLAMYVMMIFFCFHTGHCARDVFEALLCAGVGTLLAVQLILNASVVTGLLPVTGMPLPLLSYGGSGLICSLLGIGMVLSVSRRTAEAPEPAAPAKTPRGREPSPRSGGGANPVLPMA